MGSSRGALLKSSDSSGGRQWIIVTPLAKLPSVIHALKSVGKTTTISVVVFNLHHHIHHFGDVAWPSK
jgi:hypothetical protein